MNTFSKYGACLALLVATNAMAHIGIPDGPTTACHMLDSTDLATHVSAQIDDRLTLAPSAVQSLPLFSVRGDSTTPLGPTTTPWTRNADFWGSFETPIDFTGFSVWNQPYNGYSSRYQHPGTLISPRHILMATHWRSSVGTTMAFVTTDDQVVYRDVTDVIDIAGTDISVGVLDSDVPDTITYYPMIHDEDLLSMTQRYVGEDIDVPIVIFNQNGEGVIHKMRQTSSGNIGYARYYSGTHSLRQPYSQEAINGDSSHPGFVIIDDRPVFLFSIYSYSSSYNYGNYITQINAAMTTLGGGYQVTEYDTDCFDTYTANTRPNLSVGTGSYINHPLTSSPSDVVTVFTATDADVGQVLSLSLTGLTTANNTVLNPLDYFSATQVGNTLEIRHTAALDPALYGASVTLTAQVADDVIGNAGTKTATKTLYIVEPSDPSVGFYTELTISDFFGNPISYSALGYYNDLLYAFDQSSNSVTITSNDSPFNLFPSPVGTNEGGIAADADGNVYVSEWAGGADFIKTDSMGNIISSHGGFGDYGRDIVIDTANYVLYSLVGENFNSDGVIRKYDLATMNLLQTFTTETDNAYSVTVDNLGNIYTVSTTDALIRKYDSDGNLLLSFGGVGANDGQMISPLDIAIDSYGRIVVIDPGNSRIQMFDTDGTFLSKYGTNGSGVDQFNLPFQIVVTGQNIFYVSDFNNDRLVKLYFLSAPTDLDLNSGYDSGDDEDNITQSDTPVIDLACRDQYSVEMYDNDSLLVSTLCSGDQAGMTLPALADGVHILTAKSTYLGNYSAVSEPLIITVDTAAPVLAVVTAVPTPSTETSPSFTFSATEAGDVTLGGSCTTVTSEAVVGDTIITLDTAGIGTYSDCTLTVTDAVGNTSNTLVIPSFTITSPDVTPSPSSGGGGSSIVSAPASPTTVIAPVPDASVEPASTEVIPEAISLNSTAVVVTPLLPSDIVALPIWGRVPEYSRLITSLSDRIVFEKKQREATGFSYPFENPDIVAELQAVYGEAINQDIYESQCMTRAGDSAFRKCEIGFAYQTGYSFSENMLCEGFISKQPSDSQKTVLRQEALALAVGMRGDRREDKDVSLTMSDISGRDDWVASVVEKGLKQGIITAKKSLFKPENAVTRSEALAMMMKSVCMPLKKTGSDSSVSWQENIYRVAYDYGITQKSWERFYPESHLKHSEMAVFASRLADWAERTGGCDPKPEYCFLTSDL